MFHVYFGRLSGSFMAFLLAFRSFYGAMALFKVEGRLPEMSDTEYEEVKHEWSRPMDVGQEIIEIN